MHEKTKEVYRKHGVEIPFNAQDVVTDEFYRETNPASRWIAIHKIIRQAQFGDNGPQYLTWNETEYGETFASKEGHRGYPRTLYRSMGKYPEPQFVPEYDSEGKPFYSGKIHSTVERYEMEFSKENVEKILARQTTNAARLQSVPVSGGKPHKTRFLVNNGEKIYHVDSLEEFLTPSVEELIRNINQKIKAGSPVIVADSSGRF
jgi:hypothetical protein